MAEELRPCSVASARGGEASTTPRFLTRGGEAPLVPSASARRGGALPAPDGLGSRGGAPIVPCFLAGAWTKRPNVLNGGFVWFPMF